jgi:zinc protease
VPGAECRGRIASGQLARPSRPFRIPHSAVRILLLVLLLLPVHALAGQFAQREVLPNGMVLLASERGAVPIVTVSMLIEAGAYLEPADKAGLASLTADLLTHGTRSRTATEIKEAIEFVGGSLAAGANNGVTSVSLSVLKKDLDLGLDLLADILLRPTFAPEEIQRKTAEVLAAIQRKQEDPGEVAAEAFAAAVFGRHAYGRPVEGHAATVRAITREDIVRFHETYYRPNRAIVSVVGDVNPADFRQRLLSRLGAWQPGGPEVKGPPDATGIAKTVVTTIQRDVTQANIFLGHLGITRDNPDFYAVQVMNYILGGGGLTSRLVAKVREEKGWAYDVGSGFMADKYTGSFGVSLQTRNETAAEAVEAVLAEMRRIREQPVSAGELSDAKAYLTGSFPLRIDTNGKIARLLVNIEYFGLGLDYPERYPEYINRVTAQDVQRVAQKYLDPEKYALIVLADLAKAKIKQ